MISPPWPVILSSLLLALECPCRSSAWQRQPRYVAIPVHDIRWLEMAPPKVQAAAGQENRPLYTIPRDNVESPTDSFYPSPWAHQSIGITHDYGEDFRENPVTAIGRPKMITKSDTYQNEEFLDRTSEHKNESSRATRLLYEEDASLHSSDGNSGEEAARVERQSGGGSHHQYVDYGAHTGHHGAFGWHADFPVHKQSR